MTQKEMKEGLPGGWIELIAENYCNKVADGTHDSPKKTEKGKLLITSKNIKNSKLDIGSAYTISLEDFEDVNRRSKVDKWDILLGMIGTVGEVCLIDHKPDFSIKNVGLFKCGDEFKAKWLYYYFKSSTAKNYILSRLSGTTQKYITLGELRKFPIKFPENPNIQKSIVNILSSIDDKIELLREQNETLEKIGQEVFKKCFGKYKVGDELPERWRVGRLGDIIENFDSKRKPISKGKRESGIFPYYGATGVNDYVKNYIFDGIYTLLGEDGSVIKENGKPFTQYVWGKIWVNNHAHVLQGRNGFSTEMIKII
ncbi:MAG: hypothetical protein GY828_06385, partial [Candidatus Gracilibacteria bacterium]|nr:hypothetical protein [Candidatus Gracilibacteria bacterium]